MHYSLRCPKYKSQSNNKPVIAPRTINLTAEQSFIIKEIVLKDMAVPKAQAGAPEAIGDSVPSGVELHDMTPTLAEKVPQAKSHKFAPGVERPLHSFYRDFAERGGSPYSDDARFADFAAGDDILSQIFGRDGRANIRMRGSDVPNSLEFLDAINGGKRQITLPPGGPWPHANRRSSSRPTSAKVVVELGLDGKFTARSMGWDETGFSHRFRRD